MDKLDQILEKLESLERIEADIKALKHDNGEIHKQLNSINTKIDKLTEKADQSWQAVKEIQGELSDNSLKIKIIDNKVKAL